ncbi:hypothetical protein [Flavobacterium hungaricum]|uniref:Lipoprotein n=1 Tax=Flavobacterium hungaricum TaxID=2082725 RepID=A0ABR9TG75_9FLAO|nr:hypothetical protein [Flavobacterium hungaricum]MBE8723682.1 hypothetical protein [Flavobacterium hungaricum]
MKIIYSCLILIVSILSCNFSRKENNADKQKKIVSKIRLKTNKSEIDTLWVSQNDTSVFRKEEFMAARPCSKPELQTRYELISPKDNAYYFIYDDQGKLFMEGKYTSSYTYEGITTNNGNFYNTKNYSYNDDGVLTTIHYMEDGRNLKTESYDKKKKLEKIRFIDKKTGETTKIEFYDDGLLEKTRYYTSFDQYTTVKARN